MNGRETTQVNNTQLGTSWIQKAGQGKRQADLGSGASVTYGILLPLSKPGSPEEHTGVGMKMMS